MKMQRIISAIALTVGAALSAPTFADNGGILFNNAGQNENLGAGTYEFANTYSGTNYSFVDLWTFTVAENSVASVSVFDVELDSQANEPAKIFDTTNLRFTLFDRETGEFLAWANENQTLSGFNLLAGRWYTVKVFGDVGGLFGSAYHGSLETGVASVPLSDTAPLLGSALALLILRRKRAANASI